MESENPTPSEHYHHIETSKKSNTTEKIRKNPWIISTLVLGILAILLIFSSLSGGISGKSISEDKAASLVLDFVESQIDESVELVDVSSESGLYKVTVLFQGSEVPLYVTKDGKNLVQGVLPLAELEEPSESSSVEITKSDVPEVELFVMSYCPYGTQAEKGILPVVELLEDKINFKLRFVYYLMHGEKEGEENLRDYCIQKIAPEKFLDYMYCFLEGDGVESNGYIANGNDVDYCLGEAGIDKTELQNCMDEADEEFSITENLEDQSSWLSGRYPLFDVDKELNEEYGIGGSPTLVINGELVQSARDSASYLDTICQAFTDNNVPEECGEELSSSTPSPYFGWEGTGASTTAQC